MTSPRLILASRSPRRQALLRAAGLPFDVHPSDVDESVHQRGSFRSMAMRTALAKAAEIADAEPAGTLVLGADTIVVMDGRIFNKPADRADAGRMLRVLSGRTHTVLTGLALLRAGGAALLDVVVADVTFNPLAAGLIRDYLDSGEADDKAGAYGIQGLGARFVAAVKGDLTGVIGLPMGRLRAMLREMTGDDPLAGQSLRQAALRAFPDLTRLPRACLDGIPD